MYKERINIAFNLYNNLLQNYNANVLIDPSLEDLAGFEDQIRKKEKHTFLFLIHPSSFEKHLMCANLRYNKYGGV